MSDREYAVLKKREIERLCREHFAMDVQVSGLVVGDVPTLDGSYTSVFKSGHNVYALCEAETPLTLREVRSIVKLMGMEAEAYFAPGNDGEYFRRFARTAYLSVFPGREVVNDDDLRYYQTLTPYSPALMRIGKVGGQIKRYNSQIGIWQKALDYSYFRPKVQSL